MLSVSFVGFRNPYASVGACTKLAWIHSLQRRAISNSQGGLIAPITQMRGTSNRYSPPSSIYQPSSLLKFHAISHPPVPLWCYAKTSGVLKSFMRSTLPRTEVRAYSTDQSKTDADSTATQDPPPKELRTHLEKFFAGYPEFDYDPKKPCMDEFRRLEKWAGWEKKSEESQEARKGMHEALTDQFNAIYGKDPKDVAAWRNLCSALNLAEIPTEASACKKLIRSLYINIVDLVDQPVTNVRVGYFRTERELARYTREHEKFYSLQAAKAGALLKHLLCFVEKPCRTHVSRPKLRKA